jgi:hypothetical protein
MFNVLDKRPKKPLYRGRDEYMWKLVPYIIGASRRPISSIFNNDVVTKVDVYCGLRPSSDDRHL